MFSLISGQLKQSQTWREDIEDPDWFEEEEKDFQEDNIADEEEINQYLVDEIEQSPYLEPTVSEPGEYLEEIPTTDPYLTPNTDKEIIYGNDIWGLLRDSMKENTPDQLPEVIGFYYVNRYGFPAGWRIVEPHKIVYARTTGNYILVTWDRSVNGIRAFIIGNIQPNAVIYEGEEFNRKSEVMRGPKINL